MFVAMLSMVVLPLGSYGFLTGRGSYRNVWVSLFSKIISTDFQKPKIQSAEVKANAKANTIGNNSITTRVT